MNVDVVIVSYGSAETIRACVEPLAGVEGITVRLVDNASPDDAVERVADLPVDIIRAGRNGGFSFGCNVGARAGDAEYLLFLNPDAIMAPADVSALIAVLDGDSGAGVVGPAQALFLHRIWARASWADEQIRDPEAYDVPGQPGWLSGACLLMRRSAFEEIDGFDEGFFLYCEDTDICVRLRAAGWGVRYEPSATARHQEGSSAPRAALAAIHARSRIRYARLHSARPAAIAERGIVALWAVTHALVALPRRRAAARGYAAALRAVIGASS
jgi:N-acetylglucosaminyl-diphospho-decaprenol L-rhamnosyltransferase